MQGSQDNQKDLHNAFRGVYGAWVNLDGFTLGEMKELYFGFRAYEIARHEGVRHYVWANCDYALRIANWDEEYHWGHNDAKGRIGGDRPYPCRRWPRRAKLFAQILSLHKTKPS